MPNFNSDMGNIMRNSACMTTLSGKNNNNSGMEPIQEHVSVFKLETSSTNANAPKKASRSNNRSKSKEN